MRNNSTALVLSGGGAKGLYHIGAWKALVELDIPFQAVFGNSVGALVAGYILQGDINIALSILSDLNISKVVDIPSDFMDKGQFLLNDKNFKKLSSFQQNIFQKKGLDTAPLRELLESSLDEEKIRNSGIDLGIATFQINKMREREVYMEEIQQGELISYLMASATFPGFKMTKIGEDSFIDGGVYNNIPFNMARDRGYRHIIIIDIAGIGVTKKMELDNCTVTYIKNNSDVGGVLDFEKENLEFLKDLGYRDTLKVFGALQGIRYYLKPETDPTPELGRRLMEQGASLVAEDIWRDPDKGDFKALLLRLQRQLPREFSRHKNSILVMAECAALCLGIKNDQIYQWPQFQEKMKESFLNIKTEVQEKIKSLSESSASQLLKQGFEMTLEYQKKQKERLYYYYYLSTEIRKVFPLIPLMQIENSHPEIHMARIFLRLIEIDSQA